ncbi:MAG: hypothetical protein H6711_26955 [Myxococcales bacterium]|nr:hypothetical protein [Myxococcales bacterium]
MSIPRRGSRRIVVDGAPYRWRVRTRATADQRSGRTPLLLAIAAEDADGPAMIVRLGLHPNHRLAPADFTRAVTPADVAAQIRAGLAAGWRPLQPGPQVILEGHTAHHGPRVYPRGKRPPERAALAALARERARTGAYDVLRLIDERPRVTWPGGGGYDPSGLEINGRDLIAWVRDAERPHADAELAARRAEGEALADDVELAGDYLGLGPAHYRLPSGALLGPSPWPADAFAIPEDDPRRRKSTLLGCTCGITECWFLMATITDLGDAIIWSDFEQFHRDWIYDLGPFVFARDAYLAAIAAR